jgi:hypothetical protein
VICRKVQRGKNLFSQVKWRCVTTTLPFRTSLIGSQSEGKTDAADEVRRRRAVLAGSTVAPPPLILRLFRPPSRLLFPILSALRLQPQHLPLLPPLRPPYEQGIHGLGLGAGSGGACWMPHHEGARG